ncbi:MAG TPA: class I SAM-dependent methyltransferase [Bacillales bacterium]|nr:class I SAM-dependent methyltransferase [Bacillales bacterium]
MGFMKGISDFIESQYKKPKGLLGLYIGEKMVRQHQPETFWTVKLLDPQQDDKLLELGCGAGYAMKLLLKQSNVNQVVGVDLSQTILQSAMMRNQKDMKSGRARLVQGNVNQIPFRDGHFTKVFSIHSVYFWEYLPGTISEIYRVLKPSGQVIITFCNGKDGETWGDIEQQVIAFMRQAGFKKVELQKGPDSRQFHTVAVIGEK